MDQSYKTFIRISPFQLGLAFVAIFVVGFLLGNQLTTIQAQTQTYTLPADVQEAFYPLYQTYNAIQSDYVKDVETTTLVDGAISGMVDSLGDQFSGYLPAEAYQRFDASLSGDMEGIGATIRTDEATGEIVIVDTLPGAPAEGAGVQSGDVFVEVDGVSVIGLSQLELLPLVRGPAGTDVVITFRRGDELVEITITRDRFEIPTVDYEILENNIGYVWMYDFNARSREQLDEALAAINVDELTGLIFDLRGNPGGLLTSAVNVTSAFIDQGVILYEQFADGTEETFNATGDSAHIRVPIVVLVDGGSASASELFAGALQDTGVATIVGDVTFGKGSVQTIRELQNGGALRLTIARWLTPNRSWISEVGITPDILVPIPEDFDFERDGDIQLQAAVDFLLDKAGIEVPDEASVD